MRQKFKRKTTLAVSQIFILVIGIIAFSFQLGGVSGTTYKIGEARGQDDGENGRDYNNPYALTPSSRDCSSKQLPFPMACSGYIEGYDKGKTLYDEAQADSPQLSVTDVLQVAQGADSMGIPVKKYVGDGINKIIGKGTKAAVSGADVFNKNYGQGLSDAAKGYSKDPNLLNNADYIAGYNNIPPPGTATKTPSWWSRHFSGTGWGVPIKNAAWAATIYYGIKSIAPMLGASQGFTDAAAGASGWAYFARENTKWAATKWGEALATKTAGSTGIKAGAGKLLSNILSHPNLVALGVWVVYFTATYKDTKTEKIIFECKPWQANTGGSKCDECNKQGILGCNEYQCKSLGQNCEIINPGTDEEKCAWVNKNDVTPPKISIDESYFLSDKYKYTPSTISSSTKGVKIEYASENKCIPPMTGFWFGFNTNEPAYCKVDYERKNKFEDMTYNFGGSNYFLQNHTQFLSLPGEGTTEENVTLEGGGNYNLYVRCQDKNENTNTAELSFQFCIDKGPDTTAPLMVGTNFWMEEIPIGFGTQKVSLELYTNKPSDCKWSTRDQDYKNMEHDMSCSSSVTDINTAMLYTCRTDLVDLKDREDSVFYFRCKSYPLKSEGERWTNEESYKLTFKGSQPLVIDEVKPNDEIIKDSTQFVRVSLEAKTSAGYSEGIATCQYSETGDKYNDFFETNSYKHSQDLVLEKGTYKYYIKCFDLAGNSDIETVIFEVESDPYSPSVIRVYQEDSKLKLITNEESKCVYSTFGCSYSFDDGTVMATSNGIIHTTYWNVKTNFYIKCKDEYDNQPLSNECNIIVKPLGI